MPDTPTTSMPDTPTTSEPPTKTEEAVSPVDVLAKAVHDLVTFGRVNDSETMAALDALVGIEPVEEEGTD